MQGGTSIYSMLDREISSYLSKNSMTQAQIAKSIGISEAAFSCKRRGIREWSLSEAVALADILEIRLDDITEENRCSRASAL